MSEYDTFMFTYTTPPLKVVFLKDRVSCPTLAGLEFCVDQTGLKLTKVPLALCWDQRHVPRYLGSHCL